MALKQVGAVQAAPTAGSRTWCGKPSSVLRRASSCRRSSSPIPMLPRAFPLTRGEASSDGPQWSPDGDQVAFLTKRSEKTQVWVIPVHGGEARRLTDAAGGVTGFRWSPDGRRIAYTATDPTPDTWLQKVKQKDDARVVDELVDRNRLYVIDVDKEDGPKEARKLTSGELSIYADSTPGFDWSPDGKTIVFAHVPTPAPMTGPRATSRWSTSPPRRSLPSSTQDGPNPARFTHPTGSIAYVASDDPPTWAFDSCLYLVPSGGGTPRKLADSFDHRPELLGWTANGERLLYRENRGTTTRLYALPLDGEPQGFGPEEGVVAEASLNASRKAVGFGYQTADRPAEAFLIRIDRPEPVQISHVHKDLAEWPLGRTEVVRGGPGTAGRSKGS